MIRTTLRPYQVEAVERALAHDGFGLIPDMRTGKCLMSIAVADRRRPSSLLIVCPKIAVDEWHRQIAEHWTDPVPLEVINLEALRNIRRRRRYRRHPPEMMIVDEGHRIKRRSAKQSRAVRSIGRLVRWRLLLTGTAIAQGREDIWAQFEFIQPGLLGDWTDFRDRYLEMGGYHNRKVVGYRNEEELDRVFHQYTYRITLREANTKPLLIRTRRLTAPLSASERAVYDPLEADLIATIQDGTVTAPLAITLAMKLHQVCGGFVFDDAGVAHIVGRTKLDLLVGLLPQLRRPFVVVARFLVELDRIERALRQLHLTTQRVAGGETYSGRIEADVVVMQIQSGVAVDMSQADDLVLYSWDYSLITHTQSKFRILSYNKPKVSYYYLMLDQTIDEQLYEAVTRKKSLADLVCDRYRRKPT